MVQLVKNDQIENTLKNILEYFYIPEYSEYRKLYSDIQNYVKVGEGLYDSGYIRNLAFIPKDYFMRNFNAIFNFYAGGGRLDDYIQYFISLFGEGTIVNILPNTPNSVLSIEVAPALQAANLVSDQNNKIITDKNNRIIIATLFGNLSETQTESVLQLLKPDGITLKITYLEA